MHGVFPAHDARPVQLGMEKRRARRSVPVAAADVREAPGLRRVGPCLLQRLSPARQQDLVQVHAHADVRIVRDQLHAAVARLVEAPGLDDLLLHDGAARLQFGHGVVCGSGVQHRDIVRRRRAVAEAVHEGGLILGDCVNADFVAHAFLLAEKGQGQLSAPALRGSGIPADHHAGRLPAPLMPPTQAKRQSLNVALKRLRPRHTFASVFSSMVERTASWMRSFHTAPP